MRALVKTFGALTLLFIPRLKSRSKQIKLVDLVYHTDKVRTFHSVEARAKYSIENDKIFPKKSAKAGGILRYLTCPILNNGTAHSQ